MSQQQLTKLQQKAKQPSPRREPSSASDSSRQGDVHPILQLQRAIGNRRVAQLIQAKRLTAQGTILGPQRKLTVGASGDFHEREADDVARQVLATPDAAIAAPPLAGAPNEPHPGKGLAASITPVMQRRLRQDEEEGNPTLPFPAAGGRFEAGIDIEKQVELSKGHGDPLPNHVRNYMEPRFGADFGQVRIHTGSDAAQMSKDIGAQAFTHGSDIYFGAGHHPADLALTAHELTHVIQQGDASVPGSAAGPSVVQRKEFDPLAVPANNLANRQLAEAIEKTERYITEHQYVGNPADLDKARDNLKILIAEKAARTTPSPLAEGKKEAWQEGDAASQLGIVQVDEGAWFYNSMKGVPVKRLPLNTLVAVERAIIGGWYLVITKDGSAGYVDQADINTSMPDPQATLYRIKPGDTGLGVVGRAYKDENNGNPFTYSKDKRFFLNVLVLVNHQAKRPGIKNKTLTAPEGEGKADVDWEASQLFAGAQIWIPGYAYALSLHGKVPSGSISYDAFTKVADFISSAGEFLLGTVAFIAGLLHGALESLWDLLVGLVDLVKMVYSLIKSIVLGDIIGDIGNLWDTIKKIKLSDVFDAVEDWLDKKWNQPGTWSRWHFRGWLIGYIIMEIVMLVASDGLISAVKWVGKSAKIAKLIEKIPFLAKVAKRAEELKSAGKLRDAIKGSKAIEALAKARKWAHEVLAIPLEILEWLTEEAIERLKQLPAWAIERFRELSAAGMKVVLGCASKCKVNMTTIMEHLGGLAEKGYVGAKKLLNKSDVLSSLAKLQKPMNTEKIAEYLENYPALMRVIKKAELTDADLLKLGEFLTGADGKNPKAAYDTFIRYLTHAVPAKTGNNITQFNEIMEDMMKLGDKLTEAEKLAQIRQGSAFKGSMFESFAKMHVQQFQGKVFQRVRFKAGGVLDLATETRSGDFFIEATGELWDFKNSMKVELDQLGDYVKVLGHTAPNMKKPVTSIHYLFPSKAMAESAEKAQHIKSLGASVHYIDPTGVMRLL